MGRVRSFRLLSFSVHKKRVFESTWKERETNIIVFESTWNERETNIIVSMR